MKVLLNNKKLNIYIYFDSIIIYVNDTIQKKLFSLNKVFKILLLFIQPSIVINKRNM